MAYGAVVIIALTCFGPMYYAPAWGWVFWLIPIAFAWWVYRSQTKVDAHGISARTWRGSHSVAWADIKGLNFSKSGGAQVVTTSDKRLALPAVGFNDLPRISELSGGRIPNPFAVALPEEPSSTEPTAADDAPDSQDEGR